MEETIKSWTCHVCTVVHDGKNQQLFLACELCGTPRTVTSKQIPSHAQPTAVKQSTIPPPRSNETKLETTPGPLKSSRPKNKKATTTSASPWGSLRPPLEEDVVGPRKRRKGLDGPPPLLDYLMVLDFEWTADNRRRMEPVAEITQFPSVLMKLFEGKEAATRYANSKKKNDENDGDTSQGTTRIELPPDLTRPTADKIRHDALAVAAFDSFVRPTLNPRLTPFSIDLTAITQDDVDRAPTIDQVIKDYTRWLYQLRLVDEVGKRIGNWCFATWGDGDIMSTLLQDLNYKNLHLPPCFDRWINLKSDSIFTKHYHREPRGGLRRCVESVGAQWEGRAHNGLVDSINTAKIVRHMAQTGFRFSRSTRGLDQEGRPFGQKAQKEQSPTVDSRETRKSTARTKPNGDGDLSRPGFQPGRKEGHAMLDRPSQL